MGLPPVTKAEYKAYSGITSTNSDIKIDALIPQVSALVKAICGRSFVDYVATPKVEYHNGGTGNIVLAESPIISITSIEQSIDYGITYTALTNGVESVFDKTTGSIKYLRGEVFPYLINGYRVTYLAGYSVLPDDLRLAIMDLIAYYIKNDGAVHSSKAPSSNVVQVEYVTSTNLPGHIKRILDLYTESYS